jgi:hypothetical protein
MTCRYINSGQSNFEFEYLSEFETEFVKLIGYKSGFQARSIDGKKQTSKISCHCPFKLPTLNAYQSSVSLEGA